jgi:hypothetical protein
LRFRCGDHRPNILPRAGTILKGRVWKGKIRVRFDNGVQMDGSHARLSEGFPSVRRRFLLLWWLGLSLLSTAAAQIQPLQSSRNEPNPLFKFERDADTVPKTPADYQKISAKGRLKWFVTSTVGPASLAGGVFSAGLGTALDRPWEYGPHWEGFGKRYGMRLTGVSTGNAIEASLGAAMSEDPRYFRAVHRPFGARVGNILDLTFRAYHADGERHPAVSRYAATLGNNLLSDTWRAPSEADWQHALIRTAEGFGGRALSNAFHEFVPEIWSRIRRQPDPVPADVHAP